MQTEQVAIWSTGLKWVALVKSRLTVDSRPRSSNWRVASDPPTRQKASPNPNSHLRSPMNGLKKSTVVSASAAYALLVVLSLAFCFQASTISRSCRQPIPCVRPSCVSDVPIRPGRLNVDSLTSPLDGSAVVRYKSEPWPGLKVDNLDRVVDGCVGSLSLNPKSCL